VRVHPLAARRHHVDAWIRHLTTQSQPRTGRPASAATVARRLSGVARFYDYAIHDAEVISYSPVANVRRPSVSDESSTTGLSADELRRLLTTATSHSPRMGALVGLLVLNGLRMSDSGVLIAWWVPLRACGRTRWICVSGSSPQSIAA